MKAELYWVHFKMSLLILFLFLVCSCTSLKKISESTEELTSNDSLKLKGTYSAYSNKDYLPTLADFLEIDYFLKHLNYEDDDSLIIKINPIDKNHLEVLVFNHDSLQSKKTIRGKYKKNYFVLKKQHNYDPELGIFLYTWSRQKTRLKIEENGNIIIDSKSFLNAIIIGFVPIAFVTDKNYNIEFEKIKTVGNK